MKKLLMTQNTTSAYEELLVMGITRKYDINYDIPTSIIELCHIYFGSFIYPTINSKVRIKSKNTILRTFELVNRDDYCLWMKNYSHKVGIVIDHHITNGVQIQFDDKDNTKIWYEPSCFSQINSKCIKME
eukprot:82365_1